MNTSLNFRTFSLHLHSISPDDEKWSQTKFQFFQENSSIDYTHTLRQDRNNRGEEGGGGYGFSIYPQMIFLLSNQFQKIILNCNFFLHFYHLTLFIILLYDL